MLDILERTCRVCGCWEMRACAQGCYWVDADLCSACVVTAEDGTLLTLPKIPEVLGAIHPTAAQRTDIQRYFDDFNAVFQAAGVSAIEWRRSQRILARTRSATAHG